MLNHHKQQCSMDCGVSCLVTLTGVGRDIVMRFVHPSVCDYGLYWGSLLQAADILLNKQHSLTIKQRPEKLSTYLKRVKVKSPQILLCERVEIEKPEWRSHYIVLDEEENLYDPLEESVLKG